MTDRMPPEAPLAMPVQRFDQPPHDCLRVLPGSDDVLARRVILILTTLLLAAAASTELRLALSRDGLDWGDILLLLLFWPLFAWIAFGFAGSAIGFWQLMAGGTEPAAPPPAGVPRGRTAILVPVRNEDAGAVAARIAAMARSLAGTGAGDRFAFFVLSDSGVAEEAVEAAVFTALAGGCAIPVHYRRRAENIARKPGNVADWVRRYGAAWDYMLVLDADSVMDGRTIAGLAVTLDGRPGVGLIQTVPEVTGARTLFARWQQFATRLYGPAASAGLIWWSGSEGTFWGHNAILRTAAFAESCGLPELPGRAPFGGHVMSHDMVEAALLRRRGWAVHMVAMAGSAEEYPPTLVDHAIRDRRWCQGNVQHVRLLGAAGFHPINRLQLLVGASAYLTSPLWALLLLVAAIGPPAATTADAPLMLAPSPWILGLTLVLLFGPKLMGLVWALSDAGRRRAFGGVRRLIAGVAVEVPLAVLTAPATMLTQTLALIDIVRGRASGWAPQSRESEGIALADALRHYRLHVIAGLAVLAATPFLPVAAIWLLPVVVGLIAAPFLAAWTSRTDLGAWAAAVGLFHVPGEALADVLPVEGRTAAVDGSRR